MKASIFLNFMIGGVLSLCGCKKYLNEKSDSTLLEPNTPSNIIQLFNDNIRLQEQDPALLEKVVDDYYVPAANWNNLSEYEQAAYMWEGNMYWSNRPTEWGDVYDRVYTANVGLSGIQQLKRTAANSAEWDEAKGLALFTRGRAYQQAAFLWSKAYDKKTASTDLGIPLRKDDDFNEPVVRSTVAATYDQIVADFKEAFHLLPATRKHPLRASRAAAAAYLARTYLSMAQFDSCFKYAQESLRSYQAYFPYTEKSPFINDTTSFFSFNRFNPEVIFDANLTYATNLYGGGGLTDTNLIKQFADKDLRKYFYFSKDGDFRGDYSGTGVCFSGITVGEVWLMQAECLVRSGKVKEGIDLLNLMLSLYFKSGDFTAYTANNAAEALQLVLKERRKHLVRRGVRWMDIKRLNKLGAAINLRRIIDGKIYELKANSPRFALPIPEDVITRTGIPQN